MSSFWILNKNDDEKDTTQNDTHVVLSDYQQREADSKSALDEAAKKLSPSQVEEAAPQITVDFTSGNSTQPSQQTVDTSLYDITKAADDTTIPEIIISSQINDTIHKQAPLLDPSTSFTNGSIDLGQPDASFSKSFDNVQISNQQEQFTISSAPFVSSVDTSLYNTTQDMTPTHTDISPQVNAQNANIPLAQAPENDAKFTINNQLDMPNPSLSSITKAMTPTSVDTANMVNQPNGTVPLAKIPGGNAKLTITNALSMPNPSISTTSKTMTPTNISGISTQDVQRAVNSSLTLDDIVNNKVDADSSTSPQHQKRFEPSVPNKVVTDSFGSAIVSVGKAIKNAFFGKTQPKHIDTTSVDFAKALGKQLSTSEFLKGLKARDYSAGNSSGLSIDTASLANTFRKGNGLSEQRKKTFANALNNLLGIQASYNDYAAYFSSSQSNSNTRAIRQAFSSLTKSKIEAWKNTMKHGKSLSPEDIAYNSFVAQATHINDNKNSGSAEDVMHEMINQKLDEAVKIIQQFLSDPDVAERFVLQLISAGADDDMSTETFALRNDLNSIAVYMLLFGFGDNKNAMSKIVHECSEDDKSAEKVFGALPYAMSEIYETMLAGDEATIEKIRQNLISQVDSHSNQFHVLTSMDIALPEVKALSKIASEDNPKNAFAMMQPITGATTQPFNATKDSPISNDTTLKKIIKGISNIQRVKNDTSKISKQETELQRAFDEATSNAASYAAMLHASNVTPNRPYMYESVTDKGLFKEKINFAFDNVKASKLTVDNLTPYISVAFFKDNNWLVTRAPTMFMYSAVISADIEKDRDNPAATAVVTMSNTTGVLSDFTANQYSTKYSSATENAHMVGIFVEPGMNIQIRIGYTPTFSDMDVVFNGFVDGVQAGETLVVTATSYGADLLKPAYSGNEYIGVLRYAHPRDMVVNALSHVKSYHLGARSFFDWIFYNQEQEQTLVDTWLDRVPILSLVPNAFAQDPKYFQNIYAPDMYWPSGSLTTAAGAGKFLDHVSLYFSHYSTKPGQTAWSVIVDAVNRMPGFVAAVRNADERQTVFFGRPEYPYRYTYHPSLFANNKGTSISSVYKKSIMAEASKDKMNMVYNQFVEYCHNLRNDYSTAFAKYKIDMANGTEKQMANDFSSMVLSGKRNIDCILSGRCMMVDDTRFRPPSIKANSSSSALDEQIKFLTNKVDDIVNDIKGKIADVGASGDYANIAVNKLEQMTNIVKRIYGASFKAAKSKYINMKADMSLDSDVVADLLMASDSSVIEHFAMAADEISNAIYNISRGVDFSIRMAKSREMYKMAGNTMMPKSGAVPWQLIPYTGKIPATIDGSTMFRRYWIAHSSMNLISNDVHTDPQAIATSVTCYGKSVYTGWDWATLLVGRLVKFLMTGQNNMLIPEEIATINGKKMYGFKVSANKYIIPEDRKDEVYIDENANMPQIRAYVAASVLADKMSRGYNGSLVIVGNHLIEPFDSVLLDDEQSNMHGLVDVRKVMIHLSRETGLVTRVVPDMKVGIRDLTISPATKFVGSLMSIALFALTTVGIAAATIGTGGIGLAASAAIAAGVNGTIKKIIHMFLPPMTLSNSNTFVRDTSLDVAQSTVNANGITKGGAIEWKFDNALTLYPIFIGDSYYLPRMRGYNYRDREYWNDVKMSWSRYWDEVKVGFSSSLKYLNAVISSDMSIVDNSIAELQAGQNFDSAFLKTASDASNEIGGN